MAETTIYRDQGVLVTTTRVVIRSKTFALANVTSVDVEKQTFGCFLPWSLILIGSMMMIGWLVVMVQSSQTEFSEGLAPSFYIYMLLVSLALLSAGIALKLWYSYHLVFNTNANELTVLRSKDKDYMLVLVGAINRAIIERG